MKTSLYRPFVAQLALCLTAVTAAHATPASKIVGAKVSGNKLYATIQTGSAQKKVALPHVSRPAKFVIAERGKAIVYESPGKATNGYEGENAAVGRYGTDGKYSVLLDEGLNLESIRAARTHAGRTAYIISMADGGAGIQTVFVCSTYGKVWQKRSVGVRSISGGKLVLNRYPNGEAGVDAKPIGTMSLDLDTLINAAQ